LRSTIGEQEGANAAPGLPCSEAENGACRACCAPLLHDDKFPNACCLPDSTWSLDAAVEDVGTAAYFPSAEKTRSVQLVGAFARDVPNLDLCGARQRYDHISHSGEQPQLARTAAGLPVAQPLALPSASIVAQESEFVARFLHGGPADLRQTTRCLNGPVQAPAFFLIPPAEDRWHDAPSLPKHKPGVMVAEHGTSSLEAVHQYRASVERPVVTRITPRLNTGNPSGGPPLPPGHRLQHQRAWEKPRAGTTKRSHVADMIGRTVAIPQELLAAIPGLAGSLAINGSSRLASGEQRPWLARVVGPDSQHKDAVVLRLLNRSSHGEAGRSSGGGVGSGANSGLVATR
jgi:hypothetical protein